ncbi:hypothetical protein AX16_002764, partial [Volvariella volvacea WC 439]
MAHRIARSDFGKRHKWTPAHAFFLQMGGLMLKHDNGECEVVVKNWHKMELETPSGKRVSELPAIRKKELDALGRGDPFSKAIVVFQTSWYIVRCITRLAQDLMMTEPEWITLAFATLNVVTYLLWWNKPLNVLYPIYFDEDGKRVDGPEEEVRV